MNHYNDFVSKIKQKVGIIVLCGLLISALSFLFLVTNEKNFKVRTDYLVVQNSQNSTDTYALAKSAEYMGRILSEGIGSELFINEVVKTGKVNSEFLPFDKKQKLKTWEKTISVAQDADLGIIKVTVFENSQKNAINISEAISEVMTTKNNLFRGENQNIEVRVLSGPVMEKNPSISDIVAAIVAGFIFGIMISLTWIFFRDEKGHKRYESSIVFKDLANEREFFEQKQLAVEEDYIESIRSFQG